MQEQIIMELTNALSHLLQKYTELVSEEEEWEWEKEDEVKEAKRVLAERKFDAYLEGRKEKA